MFDWKPARAPLRIKVVQMVISEDEEEVIVRRDGGKGGNEGGCVPGDVIG